MSTVVSAASAQAADRPKIQSRSYAIPPGWQSVLTGLNWISTSSVLSVITMIVIVVQITVIMRNTGQGNDPMILIGIFSALIILISFAQVFFNVLGLGLC